MHELKFKVDDKVKVVEDIFADSFSHDCEIGGIFTITGTKKESRKGEDPGNYQEYLLDNLSWVTESEIESGETA